MPAMAMDSAGVRTAGKSGRDRRPARAMRRVRIFAAPQALKTRRSAVVHILLI
jgi:hypothetical protein